MNRGMNGGGPNLGRAAMLAARPQQPTMNIAAPINDVQMIALLAVSLNGSAQERVSYAQEILFEAFTTHGNFTEKMQAFSKAQQGE